jgi:hypothetical protein
MADPTLIAEINAMVELGIPPNDALAGIIENRRIQEGISIAVSNFCFGLQSPNNSSTPSFPILSLTFFRQLPHFMRPYN